eukprot:1242534-Amphidinium_carterae.3
MSAITTQKDVDMLNLKFDNHLRNILEENEGVIRAQQQDVQNYMGKSSTYLAENVQLQQRLQQMTELNQQLQNAVHEPALSLSYKEEVDRVDSLRLNAVIGAPDSESRGTWPTT